MPNDLVPNGSGEDPAPLADTVDDQLEAFGVRFRALQVEALELGINTVVGMACFDPLAGKAWHSVIRRGDWFAIRGLILTMAEEIGAE